MTVNRAADQYFGSAFGTTRSASISPFSRSATVGSGSGSGSGAPSGSSATIDLTEGDSLDGFPVPPPAPTMVSAPKKAVVPASAKQSEWLKVKPLTMAAHSTMRGELPPAAFSAPLSVWAEGGEETTKALSSFVASGSGKANRPAYKSAGPGKASTSVRFGVLPAHGNCIEVGKLPREVSVLLWSLLQPTLVALPSASGADRRPLGNVVKATVAIVACPYPLDVFSNMSIELTLWIRRTSLRLFSPSTQLTGDALLLKESLYGLLYYACHGSVSVPALEPSASVVASPSLPAPASAVTRPVGASSSAGTADNEIDASSGDDNVEDAVKDRDVEALYAAVEHVQNIPVATQPDDLVSITLRPYQCQVLTASCALADCGCGFVRGTPMMLPLRCVLHVRELMSIAVCSVQALCWLLHRENAKPMSHYGEAVVRSGSANNSAKRAAPSPTPLAAEDETLDWFSDPVMKSLISQASERGGSMQHNPLWEAHPLSEGGTLYLNPYSRIVSLKPPSVVKPCRCVCLEWLLPPFVFVCCMFHVSLLLCLVAMQRWHPRRRNGEWHTSITCRAPCHVCMSCVLVAVAQGMGKTAEMISLVLSQRVTWAERKDKLMQELLHSHNPEGDDADGDTGAAAARASSPRADALASLPAINSTLVICPLSVLAQWRDEINRMTASCKVVMHYQDKQITSAAALGFYDFVVTTYDTVSSELRGLESATSKRAPVLFGVVWDRIILDEAHRIKNKVTFAARACTTLHAFHRWCVTGTPIQNSLQVSDAVVPAPAPCGHSPQWRPCASQDLYSLMKFLRLEPWSEPLWWKRVIADPYASGDPRALQTLQKILNPLLLRRTKDIVDIDGKPIVTLPPRHVQIVDLELSSKGRRCWPAKALCTWRVV